MIEGAAKANGYLIEDFKRLPKCQQRAMLLDQHMRQRQMNVYTTEMSGARSKNDFAVRMLNWRIRRGWTRQESAAKLKVSPRTLQEWEQGRRVPSEMARCGVFAKMQEIERKA